MRGDGGGQVGVGRLLQAPGPEERPHEALDLCNVAAAKGPKLRPRVLQRTGLTLLLQVVQELQMQLHQLWVVLVLVML